MRPTTRARVLALTAGFLVVSSTAVADAAFTKQSTGQHASARYGSPFPAACTASPTTTTTDGDSYIDSFNQSATHAATNPVRVGWGASTGEDERILDHFTLPAFPAGCSTVTQISITETIGGNGICAPGRTLGALWTTGAWSESSVNWSSRPALGSQFASVTTPNPCPVGTVLTFTTTNASFITSIRAGTGIELRDTGSFVVSKEEGIRDRAVGSGAALTETWAA